MNLPGVGYVSSVDPGEKIPLYLKHIPRLILIIDIYAIIDLLTNKLSNLSLSFPRRCIISCLVIFTGSIGSTLSELNGIMPRESPTTGAEVVFVDSLRCVPAGLNSVGYGCSLFTLTLHVGQVHGANIDLNSC